MRVTKKRLRPLHKTLDQMLTNVVLTAQERSGFPSCHVTHGVFSKDEGGDHDLDLL
jgi:hypothetical protein